MGAQLNRGVRRHHTLKVRQRIMQNSGFEVVIVWWLVTLTVWVGIPAGIIYVIRRVLRAYERRTEAMARVDALEVRLARLEAALKTRAVEHPHV